MVSGDVCDTSAVVFYKPQPALASFGEPDSAAYFAETQALMQTADDIADRKQVDLSAYANASEAWMGSYKRQHKGHGESYSAMYSVVSIVKFSKGVVDDDKREKIDRLVGEARTALAVEFV